MEFPFPKKKWAPQEKQQFKKLTKIDLINLLDKDKRWELKSIKGARYTYHNPAIKSHFAYLVIHYHREGFKNIGLLLALLDQWCCTRDNLKQWKVIKG